jgi:hypothetical protein
MQSFSEVSQAMEKIISLFAPKCIRERLSEICNLKSNENFWFLLQAKCHSFLLSLKLTDESLPEHLCQLEQQLPKPKKHSPIQTQIFEEENILIPCSMMSAHRNL